MKTSGVGGGVAQPFSTSTLDGGECSTSHSGRFISGERVHGTHWIGSWVGLRAILDSMDKNKIFPLLGIEPDRQAPSLLELNTGKIRICSVKMLN
jgi:hypothetical protein